MRDKGAVHCCMRMQCLRACSGHAAMLYCIADTEIAALDIKIFALYRRGINQRTVAQVKRGYMDNLQT